MCYNIFMQKRLLRITGATMLIMPWIYIPTVYKEVIIAIIGLIIIGTTIDTKKKSSGKNDINDAHKVV